MSKEGLQKVIQREQTDSPMAQVWNCTYFLLCDWRLPLNVYYTKVLLFQGNLSIEDLRDLFTFHENVR